MPSTTDTQRTTVDGFGLSAVSKWPRRLIDGIFRSERRTPPKNTEISALPWMDPVEFSQYEAVVEAIAPECVLEWGCGGSTRALLERFPFVRQLVSVEHQRAWYERLSAWFEDERLSLFHVPADLPLDLPNPTQAEVRAWDARAEREPELMRSYVGFPRTLGLVFDLVVVDGRARSFCIAEGHDLLRSGGVLLIHDAQRLDYWPAIERLGRATFLEPWKQGQFCLIRKS